MSPRPSSAEERTAAERLASKAASRMSRTASNRALADPTLTEGRILRMTQDTVVRL